MSEVDGPEPALSLVEVLELNGYYLFHAIRADLLGRLGRAEEAASAYRSAIELSRNDAERALLERKLLALR